MAEIRFYPARLSPNALKWLAGHAASFTAGGHALAVWVHRLVDDELMRRQEDPPREATLPTIDAELWGGSDLIGAIIFFTAVQGSDCDKPTKVFAHEAARVLHGIASVRMPPPGDFIELPAALVPVDMSKLCNAGLEILLGIARASAQTTPRLALWLVDLVDDEMARRNTTAAAVEISLNVTGWTVQDLSEALRCCAGMVNIEADAVTAGVQGFIKALNQTVSIVAAYRLAMAPGTSLIAPGVAD